MSVSVGLIDLGVDVEVGVIKFIKGELGLIDAIEVLLGLT